MAGSRLRDAALGAAVLALLGVAFVVTSRLDRPITSKSAVDAALARAWEANGGLSSGVSEDGRLPPLDAPCDGTRIRGRDSLRQAELRGATYVLCHVEPHGTIGVREDLPTDVPAGVLYPLPGHVLAGGPLAQDRGILLYRQGGALRWTTSHKTARSVARRAVVAGMVGGLETAPRLAFGHAGWAPEQLEAEIAAGHWEVLP